MKLEAVLFDLYGTLVDIKTNESKFVLWESLAEYLRQSGHSVSPSQLESDYENAINDAKYQSGHKIFERAIGGLVCDTSINNPDFYRKFRQLSREHLEMKSYTHDVLTMLRDRGIKIGLVSNTEEVLSRVDFDDIEFPEHLFDTLVYSSEFGAEKPAVEIYRHALASLDVAPEKTLFVGDNLLNDVEVPVQLGMTALHINDGSAQNSRAGTGVQYFSVRSDGDVRGMITDILN